MMKWSLFTLLGGVCTGSAALASTAVVLRVGRVALDCAWVGGLLLPSRSVFGHPMVVTRTFRMAMLLAPFNFRRWR